MKPEASLMGMQALYAAGQSFTDRLPTTDIYEGVEGQREAFAFADEWLRPMQQPTGKDVEIAHLRLEAHQ